MADTNVKKRRELDSPLLQLIEETWIDYDSRIATVTIGEEIILRYTLWCIEGLKDNSGNRARHSDKMRALLFQLLKNEYGTKCKSEELNLLADVIIAYTLECLEWAQTADWTMFMSVYDKVLASIGLKDKDSILVYKNTFNAKVFEMNLCSSFKLWIADYLTNDTFLTEEDAMWAENEFSQNTLQGFDTDGQNSNNETLPSTTAMLKYCSDKEKCNTIVQMLSGCKSARYLKNAIISIDADRKMIDMCTMDNLQFCRDIVPILGYETNAEAVKQVIHRLLSPHKVKQRDKIEIG